MLDALIDYQSQLTLVSAVPTPIDKKDFVATLASDVVWNISYARDYSAADLFN
jgi:hypothetical protein